MLFPDYDSLTSGQFRVLTAVCKAYGSGHPVTVAVVSHMVGHNGRVGWVHPILLQLRELGLVTWDDGKFATIRPSCTLEVLKPEGVR